MNNRAEYVETGEHAWYCLRTQPKHEHIAAASLGKRLGIKTFLPRISLERGTRRGVKRVIEPLFPCYLFVYCELSSQSEAIRYTTGVSGLVHFGTRIPPVPTPVVEELRECFDSEDPLSVADRLRPGAEVVVGEGPFLGARGIVVRLLPARERVQILLEFLGRSTVAEVERRSVLVENSCYADLLPSLATSRREDTMVTVKVA